MPDGGDNGDDDSCLNLDQSIEGIWTSLAIVFVNILIEGIWTARKLTSNVCGWKTGATRF